MDGETISKHSFISTVSPTVHSDPSTKRSFISTVSPTVHTNLSTKRSFWKPLFKLEEFVSHVENNLKTQHYFTVSPTVHSNPSPKHSFISAVRSTVHTNPSPKRSFLRTLFKLKKFVSRVDGKQFENATFRERRRHDKFFGPVVLENKNPKGLAIVRWILNSSGAV